jgi:hypothetical protein
MPASAMVTTIRRVMGASAASGFFSASVLQLGLLLSLVVQAIYLIVRPAPRLPWWRIGGGYILLMLVMDPILWSPNTGAITRVLLPLTFGFNILLAREQPSLRFWGLFVAGNLHLLSSTRVLW